jgi:hypothetical protein
MKDKVMITVIATGMPEDAPAPKEEVVEEAPVQAQATATTVSHAAPSVGSTHIRRSAVSDAPKAGSTVRTSVARSSQTSTTVDETEAGLEPDPTRTSISSDTTRVRRTPSYTPRSSSHSNGAGGMKIPDFLKNNKR